MRVLWSDSRTNKQRRRLVHCVVAITTMIVAAVPAFVVAGPQTVGQSSLYGGLNGMAFAPDGTLFVAETGAQRLTRVDPSTGSVTPLVGGLQIGVLGGPGFPPSLNLTDVAIGSSGAMYVTSDVTQFLYKIVAETVYVPAAAHVSGTAGTTWVTDLEVHNGGETSTGFTIELLRRASDNSSSQSLTFDVAPGTTAEYRDALAGIFDFSGAAALRLTTFGDQMLVSSKTYNDLPGGTYGQLISGYRAAEAVTDGDEVRLLHLQLNNVFNGTGAGELSGGYAVVTSESPNARYFAYASVVDNRTGDAIFVPAR